ncbi:MiaB-like tRNA modifying enzyme [Candidatus Arthromitus sp. SFB-mouse-Japan]|uniref:30S ribosomal protein S12 methylthiotransferase RimO n=1 Tax=Candidatus Arthromitus sp. SFB-mouse TaxID=49118 RepID=UPI00021B7C77|nr:30S ribosomal protein S12 methylthiotransferase RimO [Candidatus Arthromitus sp. SFB-mouse]EIA27490.1 Ribosomal protein S12 methylthiotransferase rimO [Candidatus Arthromitus sp. SFB-co]EIA29137.1 Ribosomal protein S12 methylthiotransferase rimO [Candidatus Arthromitus sp. SFB-4]EIA30797.1 Ribosomal protein S12 methylthiotransferase RimO [Candidatus Arthromitus sp. SFB-mouse-SU]BAK56513.1 MiaB-like tRNA modifying enzyme [Candidatus Arthromitus sp. SFB-mouse-Japan]
MKNLKLGVISLGCDKNTIDTEMFLGTLVDKFEITLNEEAADILIINTCSFIESAKQESIDTILEAVKYKSKNLKVLVVTGCLSKRYGKELFEEIPEIDILLGVMNYDNILKYIEDFIKTGKRIIDNENKENIIFESNRILTTPKHYAYLKISEGCNNNCTFCIIPKIRGRHVSRNIESLVNEGKFLAEQGIKELILIAQDITKYGIDLYGEKKLIQLIRELSNIDGIKWIRLHYAYPEDIDIDLIEELKTNPKLCKYIDIPLQHVSDKILIRMARHTRKDKIYKLIKNLRDVPDITIRTSLIVGFPGETDEDFKMLEEFIEQKNIDNIGVFTYSQEENTAAATFDDQVDENIKIKRRNRIMSIQQNNSKELLEKKIGRIFEAIIDSKNNDYYIGRLNFQSPGIDGIIYIKSSHNLNMGEFVNVKIVSCMEYDFIGEVI